MFFVFSMVSRVFLVGKKLKLFIYVHIVLLAFVFLYFSRVFFLECLVLFDASVFF